MQDSITAKGSLHIVLTDENGNIKEEKVVPNLVVSTGQAYITGRMLNTPVNPMTHMQLGSGSTAPSAGQTDLVSPLGSRVALTSVTQQTVNSILNNSIRYVCSFGPGVGTGAVVEAGIFDAATAGTMLCRSVFSVVNKTSTDSLQITWTLTLT